MGEQVTDVGLEGEAQEHAGPGDDRSGLGVPVGERQFGFDGLPVVATSRRSRMPERSSTTTAIAETASVDRPH